MFFYISFLRPPLGQATPSGTISVTPQVANDLRTEAFDGAQDVFYSWSPGAASASAIPHITKPQKLTVWRQSSAYKEIPVPLPPGLREGQSYRLILTAHEGTRAHVINLAADDLGSRPFPVISMPILFSARAKPGGKQEQIERVYRVALPAGADAFLGIREQTSFDLDKKIWDSGIGLSAWLVWLAGAAPEDPLVSHVREVLFANESRNIIELGAGTGIVSLALGSLRHALCTEDAGPLLATDLESAMPLLEHNIAANRDLFLHPESRPEALVLDWDEDVLPPKVTDLEGGFHAIIMADVTYNTASFPALIGTLAKLIRLNSPARPPLIVLGYKERDPAERSLWDMARAIGIQFEAAGRRNGAGGIPIEVWIGRCVRHD